MLSMKRDPIVTAAYSATLFTFFVVWWSTLGSLVVDFGYYAVPILVAGVLARSPAENVRAEVGNGQATEGRE
jgi:hypothetical protein